MLVLNWHCLTSIDAKLPEASIVMHLVRSFMAEELDDVTENNS